MPLLWPSSNPTEQEMASAALLALTAWVRVGFLKGWVKERMPQFSMSPHIPAGIRSALHEIGAPCDFLREMQTRSQHVSSSLRVAPF